MKRYFWIVILCIGGYGLYWTWNSMDLVENVKNKNDFETPIVIQNPIVNSYKNNFRNIHLTAKKAELFQKRGVTRLYIVDGKVFSPKQEGQFSRFTSKLGIWNQNKKTLMLQKDVVIVLQDGKIIQSNKLTYDDVSGIINSTNQVTVIDDFNTSKILGSSMLYDTKKDRLQITYPKMFLLIN